MLSVLGRLICEELGDLKYNGYFECYKNWALSQSVERKKKKNEEIFNDIYLELKDKDIASLNGMLERLLSTIYLSLRISKQYGLVLLFYIATVIFLCVFSLSLGMVAIGIVITTVAFLFKTYEFIVNKYCYIDANIVLVYKTVLFHLILTYDLRKILEDSGGSPSESGVGY